LNMYLVRKDRRAGSPKTLSFYRVPLHLPVDADIHAPVVHPPRTPSPGRAHFGHCDMHMLPTHDAPAAQSAGPAQAVRHAPLAQAYGAQSIVIVIQAPLPLQVDAWFNVDPAPQLAAHAPLGSMPAAKGVQVPTLPAVAHEEQPPQAWSQQTPCAQLV